MPYNCWEDGWERKTRGVKVIDREATKWKPDRHENCTSDYRLCWEKTEGDFNTKGQTEYSRGGC